MPEAKLVTIPELPRLTLMENDGKGIDFKPCYEGEPNSAENKEKYKDQFLLDGKPVCSNNPQLLNYLESKTDRNDTPQTLGITGWYDRALYRARRVTVTDFHLRTLADPAAPIGDKHLALDHIEEYIKEYYVIGPRFPLDEDLSDAAIESMKSDPNIEIRTRAAQIVVETKNLEVLCYVGKDQRAISETFADRITPIDVRAELARSKCVQRTKVASDKNEHVEVRKAASLMLLESCSLYRDDLKKLLSDSETPESVRGTVIASANLFIKSHPPTGDYGFDFQLNCMKDVTRKTWW